MRSERGLSSRSPAFSSCTSTPGRAPRGQRDGSVPTLCLPAASPAAVSRTGGETSAALSAVALPEKGLRTGPFLVREQALAAPVQRHPGSLVPFSSSYFLSSSPPPFAGVIWAMSV